MDHVQFLPQLHGVRIGDDLVLLDLAADDYLCLPDCGTLRIDGARVSGPLADLLRLSAEELVGDLDASDPRRAPPALPTIGLPAVEGPRPGLRDWVSFAGIWAEAARSRPTIRTLAGRVAGRKGRRDDVAAIAARTEVFRRLLPFAPRTGVCLLQAELLLRFLNAADLDADWVFGVRLWPFLAHCWLQVDDLCVSDAPETLSSYHPILVL